MLWIAAALHLLCIPIALVMVKVVAEMAAGRTVSWGEFFAAFQATGYLALLLIGIIVQFVLACVAVMSAASFSRGRPNMAIPTLVVGIFAAVFSIAVFGGIIGLIGGILSAVGGFSAMPQRPAYPAYPPPPYVPPPPQWPPRVPPTPPQSPPGPP